MVAFYVMIALVSEVKISDVLCGYLESVVCLKLTALIEDWTGVAGFIQLCNVIWKMSDE